MSGKLWISMAATHVTAAGVLIGGMIPILKQCCWQECPTADDSYSFRSGDFRGVGTLAALASSGDQNLRQLHRRQTHFTVHRRDRYAGH